MLISNNENDNISEINNMGFVKFPYEKIISKLSSFVSPNQKVRVVAFYSCSDSGRDKANLAFLKQFGVVPQEFCISNGDSAINILSDLNDFDGLTIIVESVSINGFLLKDTAAQNEHIVSISRISGKYQRLIREKTEKISNYFKKNQHEYTGDYVYILGFSELISSTDQDLPHEAEFLPWYLKVDNESSLSRIVRQPELSLLMQKMVEVEPLIHNLDDYLAEMIKWESELDN
jgi:hypothetical protein